MNKQFFILLLSLLLPLGLAAQISINDTGSAPDSSAMLDVHSTGKGLLMPRMTSEQRDAITDPAAGLMIYNISDSCFNYFTGKDWVKDCGIDQKSLKSNAALAIGQEEFDNGSGISTDAAGNVYTVGLFSSPNPTFGTSTLVNNGQWDLYIMKINIAGQIEWAMNAGGSGNDYAPSISTDSIGNSYVTGYFRGTASFGDTIITSSGGSDVFVLKIDKGGQIQWITTAGGIGDDNGLNISIDDVGNSYVSGGLSGSATFGNTTLSSSGLLDVFVMKVDPTGQIIWATSAGGLDNDGVLGISNDGVGNVYIAGFFQGMMTIGDSTFTSAGNRDLYCAKLDPNGQFIWVFHGGGTGEERATATSTDAAGNMYLTGLFQNSVSFGDSILTTTTTLVGLFVAKFDPTGQILWISQGGGLSEDITVDDFGNSYVTGGIIGPDPVTYGDTSFQVNNNGGFRDVFVTKLDPNGEFIWAATAGGSNPANTDDVGNGIAVNREGNCFVTGAFDGTISFGDQTFTSSGQDNIFVWALDGADGTNLDTYYQEPSLHRVQDGDVNPTNEIQALSLSGSNLTISGANTIDLAPFNQSLTRSGTTLSLTNSGSVDLSPFLDNTDAQTLSFSGVTLSISGGNSTNLSSLQDDLGNHTATQNLQLSGNWLSHDGDPEGIFVRANGKVGIGTQTPESLLELEDTNPVLRLVDERVQASGTGNTMGTLEWLTRDGSHTSGFTKTGKIELVNTNNSATPDARMDFVVWEDDATGRFKRTPLSLWPNGNIAVGDGTSTPNKAKLEIFGSGSSYTVSGSSRYLGRGGDNLNTNYSGTFSLYADGVVGAAAFVAHSDARIKDIQGLSNSETDLSTLMRIEVVDYTLKDTIAKGLTPYKKVVAQQVAEVYPQAVTNTLTEVIPDIYQRAELQEGWIMLATDLQVGERVKLITEQRSEVHEVLAVEADRFQVSLLKTGDRELLSEAKSRKAGKTVFVYGREVTDFHTVDYEAISMLNVSATKEQQHRIEALEAENTQLKAEVEALKALETRLQALETAVNP
ncbi:MAG: tail fiber domain-containing protein [Bacteroidota bacterium]